MYLCMCFVIKKNTNLHCKMLKKKRSAVCRGVGGVAEFRVEVFFRL